MSASAAWTIQRPSRQRCTFGPIAGSPGSRAPTASPGIRLTSVPRRVRDCVWSRFWVTVARRLDRPYYCRSLRDPFTAPATEVMTDQDTTIHLREVARARSRPAEVDPAEPTPAHEKAGERPPEAAAKPQDTGIGGYRRRVLFVLSSIALALALYWASGNFFAYTDDSYVTSDLV